MTNQHTGEVDFHLGERKLTMQFDWRAMARAHAELGPNALRGVYDQSPEEVAKVMAIGLAKHHPEITAEDIMNASPPWLPAMQQLDRAITFAYFGVDSIELAAATKPAAKKN